MGRVPELPLRRLPMGVAQFESEYMVNSYLVMVVRLATLLTG